MDKFLRYDTDRPSSLPNHILLRSIFIKIY